MSLGRCHTCWNLPAVCRCVPDAHAYIATSRAVRVRGGRNVARRLRIAVWHPEPWDARYGGDWRTVPVARGRMGQPAPEP